MVKNLKKIWLSQMSQMSHNHINLYHIKNYSISKCDIHHNFVTFYSLLIENMALLLIMRKIVNKGPLY